MTWVTSVTVADPVVALSPVALLRWEGEDIKCMGCKISKPYVLWRGRSIFRVALRVAMDAMEGGPKKSVG